jgi:hypothetical protein
VLQISETAPKRDARKRMLCNVICQHSHMRWQITFVFVRRLHNRESQSKIIKNRLNCFILLLDTRIVQ